MKVSHYVKEVKKAQAFKDFVKEDSKAYLCSLFFIRDFNGPQSETQVDFYSPKNKNIVSFKIGKGVERMPLPKKAETIQHKKFVPKELADDLKMDIDELRPTLVDEMRNREMTYEIEKMLIVLNVMDDRPVWNCTGFLKGLGLLQAHVEDQSQSVLFMEKHSLMDMIKFAGGAGVPGMGMPGQEMPGAPQLGANLGQQPNAPPVGGSGIKIISPQELAAALQKAKAEAKAAEKTEKVGKQTKPAKKSKSK